MFGRVAPGVLYCPRTIPAIFGVVAGASRNLGPLRNCLFRDSRRFVARLKNEGQQCRGNSKCPDRCNGQKLNVVASLRLAPREPILPN